MSTRSVRSDEIGSPCAHSLRASHSADTARLSSNDRPWSLKRPCHCLSNTQNRYAGSVAFGVASRLVMPGSPDHLACPASPYLRVQQRRSSTDRAPLRPDRGLVQRAPCSSSCHLRTTPPSRSMPSALSFDQFGPRVDQRVVALLISRTALLRCDVVEPVHQRHRRVLQVAEHRHEPRRLQLATPVDQSVQRGDGPPPRRWDEYRPTVPTSESRSPSPKQLNLVRLARRHLSAHNVVHADTQRPSSLVCLAERQPRSSRTVSHQRTANRDSGSSSPSCSSSTSANAALIRRSACSTGTRCPDWSRTAR